MTLTRFFTQLKAKLIADEPAHLDDEHHYGLLASDIARSTGFHPAIIKKELDTMQAVKNPLLSANLLNQGRRHEGYGEVLKAVKHRIVIAYPDKPGPH